MSSTTNSPILNSSFLLGSNDYLTSAVAEKRYQKLGGTGVFSSLAVAGNLNCESLTIAGSAVHCLESQLEQSHHLSLLWSMQTKTSALSGI
ncbi:uncharacterized protein PHALS_14535 [Plasmopara halstedii]|uniref:Uncharacterized protein n=1 Tax=Plasmopara halstedii TaxID=4781 RepID=A0A0P1AKC7_PLAHL|nr:uncharacterized protein PHALS_14535 [Plasmopara halstedii]CEG41463.1 hypothetical protein PHALS_14535 [Plasmopara halstedii]|eukprot:XP_024577832.1 hypothetical protein PHALS_14535 [Plasmopara halstedii]